MLHQISPLIADQVIAERSARLRAEAEAYRVAAEARAAARMARAGRRRETLWARLRLRRSLPRRAGPTVSAPPVCQL